MTTLLQKILLHNKVSIFSINTAAFKHKIHHHWCLLVFSKAEELQILMPKMLTCTCGNQSVQQKWLQSMQTHIVNNNNFKRK